MKKVLTGLVLIIFLTSFISAQCIDTDNNNPFTKGSTTGDSGWLFKKQVTKQDYCVNSQTLKEFYCQDNELKYSRYTCDLCSEGKCIKAEKPTGFLNTLSNVFSLNWLFNEPLPVLQAAACGDGLIPFQGGGFGNYLLPEVTCDEINYYSQCTDALSQLGLDCYFPIACSIPDDPAGGNMCILMIAPDGTSCDDGAGTCESCACVSACTDNDGDTYGEGCAAGSDCDDNDENVHHTQMGYINMDDDLSGLEGSNLGEFCCAGIAQGPCTYEGATTPYPSNENLDCNDDDNTIYSGAEELCDSKDNDCDDEIDEGCSSCTDNDNDGYGNPGDASCSGGSETDCDDTDDEVNPALAEICDSKDNNCDTQIDEGLEFFDYYQDSDTDGYGNSAESISSCELFAPNGYVDDTNDCDDTDDQINPLGIEICGNGIDEDCDGSDLACPACTDNDGDTYGEGCPAGDDCNDDNVAINPGAEEICGNGIDEDCSGSDLACPPPGDDGGDSGPSSSSTPSTPTTPTTPIIETDPCEGCDDCCIQSEQECNPQANCEKILGPCKEIPKTFENPIDELLYKLNQMISIKEPSKDLNPNYRQTVTLDCGFENTEGCTENQKSQLQPFSLTQENIICGTPVKTTGTEQEPECPNKIIKNCYCEEGKEAKPLEKAQDFLSKNLPNKNKITTTETIINIFDKDGKPLPKKENPKEDSNIKVKCKSITTEMIGCYDSKKEYNTETKLDDEDCVAEFKKIIDINNKDNKEDSESSEPTSEPTETKQSPEDKNKICEQEKNPDSSDALSYLENPLEFLDLSNQEKNELWANTDYESRNQFVLALVKSVSNQKEFSASEIESIQLDSCELTWNNKKLTNQNAWIDFNDFSFWSKRMIYNEEENLFMIELDKNRMFNFDKGTIDSNDKHIISSSSVFGALGGLLSSSSKQDVYVRYGDGGTIEYKQGKYSLYNDGAMLMIESENSQVYFNKDPEEESKIPVIELKNSGYLHKNAEAQVLIKNKAEFNNYISAKFLSDEQPIMLFVDPKVHQAPYQQLNPDKLMITIDSQEIYSVAKITSDDFKLVQGAGTQCYLMNSPGILLLSDDKQIYSSSAEDNPDDLGSYNVKEIRNLGNDEPNYVYAWLRYKDNEYADLISPKSIFQDIIAQASTGWLGRLFQIISNSQASLDYNKEYQQGYYQGTEIQRRNEILQDSNTNAELIISDMTPIPGQFVAAQLASMIEIGMIIGQKEMKINPLLNFNLDENARQVLQQQKDLGNLDSLPLELRRKIDLFLNTNLEDGQERYEVNHLLNVLSNQYAGNDLNNLRRNTQGVYRMKYTSNAVYINGEKVEGISPEVADALKTSIAENLFYYVKGQGIRNPDFERYHDEIQEKYAFGEDYLEDQFADVLFGTVYGGLLREAAAARQYMEEIAAENREKYYYYVNKGTILN